MAKGKINSHSKVQKKIIKLRPKCLLLMSPIAPIIPTVASIITKIPSTKSSSLVNEGTRTCGISGANIPINPKPSIAKLTRRVIAVMRFNARFGSINGGEG